MRQEEGILPVGHAVGEAEAQEAGAREAVVWGAAVRFMSCHMVQATMCLKLPVHHCVCSGGSIDAGGISGGVFLLQRKVMWETGVLFVGHIKWGFDGTINSRT